MAVSNKTYSFEMKESDIRAMLKSMIHHDHSDIIVEVLVNQLNTFAIGLLYNAHIGIMPDTNMYVGQEVLIPLGSEAFVWRYGKEHNEDLLVQGKYIKGTVIDVNPYLKEPVTVEYSLKDSEGKLRIERRSFNTKSLIPEKDDE